jgi:hypothetical protein
MSYETIVFETEGEAIASRSTVADSRARAACSYTLPGVFVHALLGAAERPTLELSGSGCHVLVVVGRGVG